MSEEQEQAPKSKASRAEVAQRVAEVLRIRLDGAAFHDVVDFAKGKCWNVSERQCGRYIEQADKLLAGQLTKDTSRVINLHVARCESLFARAVNAADYRTGLAVLAELAKLRNLYAAEKNINDSAKQRGITMEEAKEVARQALMELPPPPEYKDIPEPPDDE